MFTPSLPPRGGQRPWPCACFRVPIWHFTFTLFFLNSTYTKRFIGFLLVVFVVVTTYSLISCSFMKKCLFSRKKIVVVVVVSFAFIYFHGHGWPWWLKVWLYSLWFVFVVGKRSKFSNIYIYIIYDDFCVLYVWAN